MKNKAEEARANARAKRRVLLGLSAEETISEPEARRRSFLALREKHHEFDQLMYQEQKRLREFFGALPGGWSPPSRSIDELNDLFFQMFGDLEPPLPS
jgi:hypothetical protein